MADPASYLYHERDIDQAIVILKKGTQLLKYSRKGKPKFRAFRLSPDEKSLVWFSRGEEKGLNLSEVSRIVPGQRTAVFKRFLRPEKDHLSFSLLYNNRERSLDLICKDKAETEVWFAALKSIIEKNRNRRARSEIPDINDCDTFSIGRQSIDFVPNNIPRGRTSIDLGYQNNSDVGYDRGNMLRPSTDGFRISVSSTPSCSSGGSGPDDIESLGDVYVWGEVWTEGILPDGTVSKETVKTDVLTPRPLESNVVLDVHQIVCGVRHVALVTRQGEVFTWGEEAGGRLGHGIQVDISRPKLVEFLALTNIDFVACGEYHTCVVSTSGDLFSWGDGIHNVGLLGHGSDISHWIPKRVSGPLEGLQVLSVACGTWHSALATANGKLFTFGDGAFGVLGHGNRESVSYPKEVQSLNGLKTVKVACSVWHTVAIVEVMGQTGTSMSSRKLFTWGDGDKNRLGHGNKETYLFPTCVSSLIDYNFHKIACGLTFTVALTTSGHVFTMGGTANGQLGNSVADGKLPCLVQDRLVGEFVEEIACGDHHVAVLTSRSEVFTWGKGANGRLGHGDTDDRRTPNLVEALKDRHVKSLSCGSNFTSSICIHKWVSGADQSICSGCRQAFGFTRKRHNCYNCGLVHCHACSSKKALKAALAPTPGKPHRVCDSCYSKLKAAESGYTNVNRNNVATPGRSMDGSVRIDKETTRSSKILLSGNTNSVRSLSRPGITPDSSSIRASQVPSLQQLKDIAFPSPLSAIQNAFKPVVNPAAAAGSTTVPSPRPFIVGSTTVPSPPPPARSSSPYARRPSPPRTSGFSRSVIDSLKKTNEVMNQEMTKLQSQVKNLKEKCNNQGTEIQRFQNAAKEAYELAAKQSSKHKAATETLKSVAEQLKGLKDKLPPEVSESEAFESINSQADAYLNANEASLLTNSNIVQDQKIEEQVSSNSSVAETSNSSRPPPSTESSSSRTGGKESKEQFEPGVYVTYKVDMNGNKIFQRVRFSKKRFDEHQAEDWWTRNKDRLLKCYGPNSSSSSSSSSNPTASDSPIAPPPPQSDPLVAEQSQEKEPDSEV
ncbi:PH, RCC1 and FYVE domains-containing protein 1 [Cardamine amara subsp. amara]|uniref:PH, RCC1 and FYVE domains-containing protein 1 n=1 Tax=Cardamine amara subsp. amara TaxID=228776 RepID=A0ABD1B251_CARAN